MCIICIYIYVYTNMYIYIKSSNLPDHREIVKLIVVNVLVAFLLKPIYIYIYI